MELGKKKIWVFYLLSAIFIALNAFAIVTKETIALTGLPVLLLVAMFAFFAMDKLLMLIVFLTPFSIPLHEILPSLSFDMSLPTEPLIFGAMLLFFYRQALMQDYDRRILSHPVSLAIYFYLGWMLFTSITSSIPEVSFKYFVSKLWFIVCFYFMLLVVFRNKMKMRTFLWVYIIPLVGVMLITLIKHSTHGFDQRSAHFVMHPFYKDHTSYGALLALFLPILLGFFHLYKKEKGKRLIVGGLLGLFALAIVLSYTRAAWVSLLGALGVYVVIKLKINYKWILGIVGLITIVFMVYRTDIMIHLEQNKTDSSTDFKEHVKSISNVATDASNKERINRWNSALRMFQEKPYLGWGPGTYQFQYAPFQMSYEKTIISTNAGNMGNAHSEYLGPLSESGIFGLLSFLIMVFMIIITALKVYHKTDDPVIRTMVMMALTALVTYFLHGFLNNFLDTDKAAIPFWGLVSIIVALDIYHTDDKNKKDNQTKASIE